MSTASTPYPEINKLLAELMAHAYSIIGNLFTGLYLHGSLAYGDFNPRTSDIDFLVVTEANISNETFIALKKMHSGLFSSGVPWSQKLEGAYLPKEILRRHDQAHGSIPWLGVDGHFALEKLGNDWILQRWILREKGVGISGPPLRDLIDPITPDDLRGAVRGSLIEWWSPPFPSLQRFQIDEYQVYVILTMCRSLYVLENRRIATKPEAARWAMTFLKEPWVSLVAAASAWETGMVFNHLEEMFGLIRYTLRKYGLPDVE